MKICIDAGHNYSGWTTGAGGCGLREEVITWQIADKLRTRLENAGVTVIMTRKTLETNLGTNNATSLSKRVETANSHDCDLFVSIHCNAGGGTGCETLIFKSGGEAEKAAWKVQNSIVGALALRNRGVKVRPDLYVLKHTEMPAILVETAFIDNADDAAKLRYEQDEFANAICKGICEYTGTQAEEAAESAREKAERIIRQRCDSPEKWIGMCDTVPWFSEFVCKIYG